MGLGWFPLYYKFIKINIFADLLSHFLTISGRNEFQWNSFTCPGGSNSHILSNNIEQQRILMLMLFFFLYNNLQWFNFFKDIADKWGETAVKLQMERRHLKNIITDARSYIRNVSVLLITKVNHIIFGEKNIYSYCVNIHSHWLKIPSLAII